MGRPRKPTTLLKIHGTFREDRRATDEPMPAIAIPSMPKFLKGEAAAEWERVAPLLAKMKCLTEWDRSLLAAYCFEWGVYVELCKKVKLKDLTITTVSGNKIYNPLLASRNKALSNLKELAIQFGLSPSSRSRLSVSEEEESNPFLALLQRRGIRGS
ncbi:MAG: phage terminase small subunit P27 family [Sedimentisphaerales bacterium]|nr:phage terminase small subunit P27 family [Sedimentisphaerales bacterium]